ncbi:MAG: carbonic anhydrase [Oligoflexia bacterium]|nr:carbonic anhydrase [Oligoflexia bacterium]
MKTLYLPLWVVLSASLIAGCAQATVNAKENPTSAISTSPLLEQLKQGNERFVQGAMIHPRQDPPRRQELATAQSPRAIVLSCSDSRLPPEMIFDAGLGDLFVARVAGNIAEPATLASIEYAVAHFTPELLIVLGHDSCGAVDAALHAKPGQSSGSRDLDFLVSTLQSNLQREHVSLKPENSLLRKQVAGNVDAVAEELIERSSIVRDRVHQGKLRILRAIYELKSGQVEFLD